jgi:hypothetical protein
LSDQQLDTERTEKDDTKHLEESLQALWEKAHTVSDVLLRLKAENKELQSRISSLELKEHHSMEELQRREHEMSEIRMQLIQAQSNGKSFFSKEELEVLKSRLKELIVKINSRV